jgi:hypothetical protein
LWKLPQLRNSIGGYIRAFGLFVQKIKPVVSKEVSHFVGPVAGWQYQFGS